MLAPRYGPAAAARSGASTATSLSPEIAPDGAFAGYASLFDTPDDSGDVIARGAFTETLARRGVRNIRLLFQHDAAQPLGVWTTLRQDSRGLYAEGQLTLENARSRDILALLKSGAIDGLSIGFRAAQSARNRRPANRLLTRIDLWEISIVTFPMLAGARITAVKSRPRLSCPAPDAPLAARIAYLAAAIRSST